MRLVSLNTLALLILIFALETRAEAPKRLVPTAGVTYSSIYVTDGFRVGDATPVFQFALKLTIPSTHISLMYWNSLRQIRSRRQYDEHDFMALYNRDFKTGSKYAFNLHGFYDYWTFPNTKAQRDPFGDVVSNGKFRGSKLHAGISMTNLIPLAGSFLIPAYNVYYWIYWAQDREDLYRGGARHELSLSYTRSIATDSSTYKWLYAGGSASLSYHDGAFGVRRGVSHSLVSLYTGLTAWDLNFSLSGNQQFSYQRTVNTRNDYWTSFSVFKDF